MAEKHLIDPPPPGSTPCSSPCHTPYYQEEIEEYGGAAVMRMDLGSQKVGLSPLPSQTDLYNDAIAHNDSAEPAGAWHIDPQGMRDALNALKPASFSGSFVNYNFPSGAGPATPADRDAANAKIIYTIDVYEVAPAVLVTGAMQWLAVVGYRTNDADDTLEMMFVNDPRPPVSVGTGDPPDHPIPAATWNDTYLKTVSGGTRWNGQYTMVCDPDEPEGELHAAVQKPRADGRQILPPDQILEQTREILEEQGLLRRRLFARAVEAGQPVEPHLVQILHREDQFYYLVRYQIEQRDAALIAVDARFGILLEAIAYPEPLRAFRYTREEIPRLLTQDLPFHERAEDARNRIIDQLIRQGEPGRSGPIPGWDMPRLRRMVDIELSRFRQPVRRREIRRAEINVHPLLVWQPSQQSMSLLYPSYLVNTPRQTLYVRAADGLVFDDWIVPGFGRLGG